MDLADGQTLDKVVFALPRMSMIGKLLEEQDGDVLREGIRVPSQPLMETEVAGLIGAERHERTGERTTERERVIFAS